MTIWGHIFRDRIRGRTQDSRLQYFKLLTTLGKYLSKDKLHSLGWCLPLDLEQLRQVHPCPDTVLSHLKQAEMKELPKHKEPISESQGSWGQMTFFFLLYWAQLCQIIGILHLTKLGCVSSQPKKEERKKTNNERLLLQRRHTWVLPQSYRYIFPMVMC